MKFQESITQNGFQRENNSKGRVPGRVSPIHQRSPEHRSLPESRVLSIQVSDIAIDQAPVTPACFPFRRSFFPPYFITYWLTSWVLQVHQSHSFKRVLSFCVCVESPGKDWYCNLHNRVLFSPPPISNADLGIERHLLMLKRVLDSKDTF